MISSADVKPWHLEAMANACMCRGASWGRRPCQWERRDCPFGRALPQKPSDPHCGDVTAEMWDAVLAKEDKYSG